MGTTALLSTAVAAVLGWWIGTTPRYRPPSRPPANCATSPPGGQYETYYSSHPAASFAAQVWTNNAWAAALCLIL
ncbi:stage II sporulation protein M, partial [Streptomyces afghaniensis]|uniref:stage II sporulation protein M n=1 Tax=Streptomyces afghaniensis TaxID=66865 RepID=UPI0031450B7B